MPQQLLEEGSSANPKCTEDVTLPGGYEEVQSLLDACMSTWMAAWAAGDYLVIDESMVGWSGMGQNELTYLPRKPCDLGVMMKTLCCSESGIMLRAEIAEGKAIMQAKEHVKEWG